MKIAIFYNLAFGGAKRVVMEHAKGLKNKGHTIDLYATNVENDVFDPSPYCKNIYNYPFELNSKLPFLKRFINDYKNFFLLKKLHKKIAFEIDNRNYDLILIHPDKFTQAPFLLRFLKTPSVYYCQEPLRIVYEYSMRIKKQLGFLKRIYEELTRLYRKKIDRQNVRSASFTIASCYHIRERMIESYEVYPKVVYCAVDDSIFKPLNLKKKNQIFYVGSPTVVEDGFDLTEKALEYIPQSIRPELCIVSWKKANGERLSEIELVKIYNESLVTLCTSRLETFGLVPLESMACGTPVIATKISGHRETIDDGKTGFLVDFDPEEIAQKIIFLIKNAGKARNISKNARKQKKKVFSWSKKINELNLILTGYLINIQKQHSLNH